MAQLITGNLFKLLYSDDPANNVPMGASVKEISNLAEIPTLTFKNTQLDYETYDSNYKTVLLSNKDVEPFDIVIHYVPTEESTVFLDSMAKSRKDFQSILNYRQTDGTIDYAIVSGVITATSTTGDKDSVVNKVYTFTPLDVISELRTINALQPLYEGSFGVGSNGVDVPQYEPVTPDGNSFIKVPADQADNPVGADMLGIGLVDMSSVCKLAISKAGNLNIYAMNTSTAWTRILTATQIANQYVPLSRTVNGKALTSDIVLNNTDVGLGNVTNEKQLVASKNLSDVTSVITARKNLDVYSTGEVDSKLTDINNNLSGNYATKQNLSDAVQPLATKTELSDTAATLVPKTTTVNGKALSGNVVINSADVGLGNVTNEKQLVVSKNLSDLGDVNTARTNLGLGSMALQNSNAVNITGGQAVLNYISSTSGGFNSTASNPLSIASVSPTIKFTEAGVKDWFLVANGGSIRLQPDSTGSPDIAFSFNPATKLMSLMNVNASSLTLGTALGILSGGTGANNVAGARTNLGVDLLSQNSNDTSIFSPNRQNALVQYNTGQWGSYSITNNRWNYLAIAQGGTGAGDAGTARTNLGLGSNNTPTFGGADLTTSGVANSGILTLNIANTSGATTSSGRLYHEVQNGVGKMTFHVSANGKNAYMQLDEDGKLIVPGTLSASGGITANSSIIAAQGQVVGLTTTSGGNKNIFLSNAPGDGSSGGWVNFVHGDWYSGYWNMGAVRGSGTDISSVTLEVNSNGAGSNAFRFYPSYGGHMLSPKGYTVNSGTAGSWGIENNYMVSAYYIPTVIGNVGGWTPFLSGGSTSTGGGYDTRIAFGALGAVNNWSAGVIKLLGDGKFHRAYQFGIDGSLYSWASPEFGSNLIFTSNATSDRTLKHDIQYTDGKESYERVKQWLPTMFKYNGQDVQRYGLIAQDLQAIDEQYVKAVPGSPIFEEVEEIDEETGETKKVSKETGEYHPDTLSLDNNVLLTDLSCAFVYESGKVEKLQSELDELKALVQKLLDK